MDLGEPFPARAQLLHAAARTGGAAAGDLYRLADAPHARRHHGRRAVRHSRHHRHHGAQLRLCRLRQRAGDRRAVLRPQGRGAGDRAGGGVPHRQALAQEQRDAPARGGGLRRHLLFQHSVSDHHFRRRLDRLSRRLDRRHGISQSRAVTAAASRTVPWSKACSATSCPTMRGRPLRGRYGRRAYGWCFGSFR